MRSSTASVLSQRQTSIAQRPYFLLRVMGWEVRRLRASRAFWIVTILSFCLFLLVMWVGQGPASFGVSSGARSYTANVAGTSAWGLILILPPTLAFLLAAILPFISADGVARDVKRGTHELLMTTALPTWAYIWGRYLMALLLSLGLAVLILIAILVMGMTLHLTQAQYPAPQVSAVLAIWAFMILPITFLLSSLSFALGLWLPRRTNLIKAGVLVLWLMAAVVLPSIPTQARLPSWYLTWEPTNLGMSALLQAQYPQAFPIPSTFTDSANPFRGFVQVEQHLPDLSPWLLPHLVWAGLGLALAVLAAISFKRFRNVPN